MKISDAHITVIGPEMGHNNTFEIAVKETFERLGETPHIFMRPLSELSSRNSGNVIITPDSVSCEGRAYYDIGTIVAKIREKAGAIPVIVYALGEKLKGENGEGVIVTEKSLDFPQILREILSCQK